MLYLQLLGYWNQVGVLAGKPPMTDARYHIRVKPGRQLSFTVHFSGVR